MTMPTPESIETADRLYKQSLQLEGDIGSLKLEIKKLKEKKPKLEEKIEMLGNAIRKLKEAGKERAEYLKGIKEKRKQKLGNFREKFARMKAELEGKSAEAPDNTEEEVMTEKEEGERTEAGGKAELCVPDCEEDDEELQPKKKKKP
ncbi:hypothetical protein Tco_1016635 [Tanacetum coccineum]|uniref:Uncharacterized protein n=1 Tax=Tanacetum coccineum TaxID=301880 RepID=A0ABQ5FPE9_9ASTR